MADVEVLEVEQVAERRDSGEAIVWQMSTGFLAEHLAVRMGGKRTD